jgi:hypothetical protein
MTYLFGAEGTINFRSVGAFCQALPEKALELDSRAK